MNKKIKKIVEIAYWITIPVSLLLLLLGFFGYGLSLCVVSALLAEYSEYLSKKL